MILNTFAGRSYNDLSQYPIFPQILNNFSMKPFDFNDNNNYRDLSKPINCQSKSNAEKIVKHYNKLIKLNKEPFHHNQYYLNYYQILYYLKELNPFTLNYLQETTHGIHKSNAMVDNKHNNTQKKKKNGNHKDGKNPNIEIEGNGNYQYNINTDNIIYNKKQFFLENEQNIQNKINHLNFQEFIPEFYYLPEFLININNYGFKGLNNDIQLPLWVKKNDQRLFIKKHLEALESEYTNAFKSGKKPKNIPQCKSNYFEWDSVNRLMKCIKVNGGSSGGGGSSSSGGCGRNIITFVKNIPYQENIHCYEILKNQEILLTAGESCYVIIWKMIINYKQNLIQNLIVKERLYGHNKKIISMSISEEFNFFVTGSQDNTCIIWDLNTFKCITNFGPLPDSPLLIAISKITGEILVYTSNQKKNTIYLFSINGFLIKQQSLNFNTKGIVRSALFSVAEYGIEKNLIFLGMQSGNILVYDTLNLKLITKLKTNSNSPILSLSLSKKIKSLFSGDQNGRILKWKI